METLIGLSVQSLIWISLFYLLISSVKALSLLGITLIFLLLICLYIYFVVLLFRSNEWELLTMNQIKVTSVEKLIRLLKRARPYTEIQASSFYDKNKTIKSSEDSYLFKFNAFKDITNDKELSIPEDEAVNRLNIVDLDITVRFNDPSARSELEEAVTEAKNRVSITDKYFSFERLYKLKGFELRNNIVVVEGAEPVLVDKVYMMISYFLLIGEFYKIYINRIINRKRISIVKQINRKNGDPIGEIVENANGISDKEEDEINESNLPETTALMEESENQESTMPLSGSRVMGGDSNLEVNQRAPEPFKSSKKPLVPVRRETYLDDEVDFSKDDISRHLHLFENQDSEMRKSVRERKK